jgi:GNAT superfamily N-acetyltransferase
LNIIYKRQKRFSRRALADLFLSVEWESGKFPDRLQKGIRRSSRVVSAWEGKKLVGLVNCLSDDSMVVYVYYLLVRPEYQKQGIGRRLLETLFDEYKRVRQKVLIAHDPQIGFYKKMGLEVSRGYTSMHKNEF